MNYLFLGGIKSQTSHFHEADYCDDDILIVKVKRERRVTELIPTARLCSRIFSFISFRLVAPTGKSVTSMTAVKRRAAGQKHKKVRGNCKVPNKKEQSCFMSCGTLINCYSKAAHIHLFLFVSSFHLRNLGSSSATVDFSVFPSVYSFVGESTGRPEGRKIINF